MRMREPLFSIVAFCLAGPAICQAHCTGAGQISGLSTDATAGTSSFYVVGNGRTPKYQFSTSGPTFKRGLEAAERRHMIVQVTGLATTCPAPARGIISGGTVETLLKVSEPRQ